MVSHHPDCPPATYSVTGLVKHILLTDDERYRRANVVSNYIVNNKRWHLTAHEAVRSVLDEAEAKEAELLKELTHEYHT